jgi:hypothetical protein
LAFTIATTFACGATRFENLALDSMAQYTPDDAMIDAAYANSAVNFDTEEF